MCFLSDSAQSAGFIRFRLLTPPYVLRPGHYLHHAGMSWVCTHFLPERLFFPVRFVLTRLLSIQEFILTNGPRRYGSPRAFIPFTPLFPGSVKIKSRPPCAPVSP